MWRTCPLPADLIQNSSPLLTGPDKVGKEEGHGPQAREIQKRDGGRSGGEGEAREKKGKEQEGWKKRDLEKEEQQKRQNKERKRGRAGGED